jgi:hypothetical protein
MRIKFSSCLALALISEDVGTFLSCDYNRTATEVANELIVGGASLRQAQCGILSCDYNGTFPHYNLIQIVGGAFLSCD